MFVLSNNETKGVRQILILLLLIENQNRYVDFAIMKLHDDIELTSRLCPFQSMCLENVQQSVCQKASFFLFFFLFVSAESMKNCLLVAEVTDHTATFSPVLKDPLHSKCILCPQQKNKTFTLAIFKLLMFLYLHVRTVKKIKKKQVYLQKRRHEFTPPFKIPPSTHKETTHGRDVTRCVLCADDTVKQRGKKK